MQTHIWLRAETKPLEERIALTPNVAQQLMAAGFKVTVEESVQSAIAAHEYQSIGCDIAPTHSWRELTDTSIIVLGLKELEEQSWPLIHRHIHFAHAYKNQQGWQGVLQRFVKGDGQLFDLEYLVDDNNRRVAAFGYWAGFAGAAVALKAFAGRVNKQSPILGPLQSYKNQQTLVDEISGLLANGRAPTVLVIGAKGRSGRGAVELAQNVGAKVTQWDIEETQVGGPFEDILTFDVVVNCVFVQQPLPPFVTTEMLASKQRKLSIICDVSCDPYGDYNPLPIYDQCTMFDNPTLRLIDGDNPLDLIAIDHLPSLLPVESSEDFCQQLLPHLLQLDNLNQGVWQRANAVFNDKIKQI